MQGVEYYNFCMKNKKNFVIIGVILLAIVVFGLFFAMKKSPAQNQQTSLQTSQPNPTTIQTNTANGTEALQATLKSLLTAGRSMKCTFSDTAEKVNVEGTVYAAGGKVREDFQSNASEMQVKGHLIVDTTDAYMWTDLSNQGFKFPINDQSANAGQNKQAPDMNKTMKFSCKGSAIHGLHHFFLGPSLLT